LVYNVREKISEPVLFLDPNAFKKIDDCLCSPLICSTLEEMKIISSATFSQHGQNATSLLELCLAGPSLLQLLIEKVTLKCVLYSSQHCHLPKVFANTYQLLGMFQGMCQTDLNDSCFSTAMNRAANQTNTNSRTTRNLNCCVMVVILQGMVFAQDARNMCPENILIKLNKMWYTLDIVCSLLLCNK
jgi:hypothetical protein